MLIKYKNIGNQEINTIESNNMTLIEKSEFIKLVFNFNIIILDIEDVDNNIIDKGLRVQILNGDF